MFFVLSKTVTVLFVPSNVILFVGLAGLVMMVTRWRRAGTRLTVASVILLLIVGTTPLGIWLTQSLETRFTPWEKSGGPSRGAPDGIIILGGGISSGLSRKVGTSTVSADGGRLIALAHLARLYPKARIIYSGGDASLGGNKPPETDYVGSLLDDFGIARSRVELETRSRNTAENAAFTRAIAKPRPGERWLLVTSAQHMPRAVGCFRKVGFPVEAYPAVWRTDPEPQYWPDLAVGHNLDRFDNASREWLGLVVYRLTGKTPALFPAP
ncbi:MAG: YdcF family protein [Proteobacteria bacterium]|nr:YdcF family protein [Pseudomonadota bacterium]